MSLIDIASLTCRFGGLTAVNSVSLSVEKNEIFGIIGPNGAGKTTFFNMLSGLQLPTSGKIEFLGENMTGRKSFEIARKGMARTFQNIRLFEQATVLENVLIARHIHEHDSVVLDILGSKKVRKSELKHIERVEHILRLLSLDTKHDIPARDLSYGDKRRVEIARALALEPKVLLLDEPTAGMNLVEKSSLAQLIKSIRLEFSLTILLIEHHVPLMLGLCDRIAVLNFGQLIALDTPANIRNNPAVIEAYLGAPQ